MLFKRNIKQLEKNAVLWWSSASSNLNDKKDLFSLLKNSQSDFISILEKKYKKYDDIFVEISKKKFPGNLFLKHLSVLIDYGGENFQRLNNNFSKVFNYDSKPSIKSLFNNKEFTYYFKKLPLKNKLTNQSLGIDGEGIYNKVEINDLQKDVIVLLLFGSKIINSNGANLNKCNLGQRLGNSELIKKYIMEKYLIVSRIVQGAVSNTKGQNAQKIVFDYLNSKLSNKIYEIKSPGKIFLKNIQDKKKYIPFDITVNNKKQEFVGIEISFQETTNSVIERKARESSNEKQLLNNEGHYISYVIDGAGNFERRSAVETICNNSDCTVAYTNKEFDVLVNFIKKCLN